MSLEYLQAAVAGQSIHVDGVGDIAFEPLNAGTLVAPTGRIVACDPFCCPGDPPFIREVQPGKYPVTLLKSRARLRNEIAFAKIEFASGAIQNWELAERIVEPSGEPVEEWERVEYWVDSGTGCFMDRAAAEALGELIEKSEDFTDPLSNYDEWAEYVLESNTRLNLIYFQSGWGDGTYKSYFGFDAVGNAVCLVTDFETFVSESHPIEPPKRWWQFWK